MKTEGLEYAMKMTNELAFSIDKKHWDVVLIDKLGSLQKLFVHMIRVRNTYCEGLKSGNISFPGNLPSPEINIQVELRNSCAILLDNFKTCTYKHITFNGSRLTIDEVYSMTVQHEGIHQGQFSIALKTKGIQLPETWITDWHL
ncbi:DinB family protein [Bacillus sp. C1-1]|nr:DinB family protein [Bacillus sp. C1-1]